VSEEKLRAAVLGFADVEAFTPDASNLHVATATLKFRQPVTLEEGALHFGEPMGSLVILGSDTVSPGEEEDWEKDEESKPKAS
jgi:hypothetical protein